MPFFPSMSLTQRPGHRHGFLQVYFFPKQNLSRHGTIKAVNDPPGHLFRHSITFPMSGCPDSGRQFKQMYFTNDKIIANKFSRGSAGSCMIFITLIEIT